MGGDIPEMFRQGHAADRHEDDDGWAFVDGDDDNSEAGGHDDESDSEVLIR